MQPLQLILTATALLASAGGLLMLFRPSSRHEASPRKAYLPLATTAVGLIIAYRSISEFSSMDAVDLTIMFLFALGLLSFMGLQFLLRPELGEAQEPRSNASIEDKRKQTLDLPNANDTDNEPSGNS
jgi:hypothetical protein